MRTEDQAALFSLLGIAVICRAFYEMSRPEQTTPREKPPLYDKQPEPLAVQDTFTSLQRKWADKAVKGYAKAQEKKWLNWSKAMYERPG